MTNHIPEVEQFLQSVITDDNQPHNRLKQAMLYSLLAGGKRTRMSLMLMLCECLSNQYKSAIPVAASIELIHCYSLNHDDLPCMDDDDLRRGKPSCHIQFDEATSLLAGDAMLTLAFEVISNAQLPPSIIVKCISYLAKAIGTDGMVGGQMVDLICEDTTPSVKDLEFIYINKTCKLIMASCVLAGYICECSDETISKLEQYALNLGMAFQLIDDILDVEGDQELIGKPVNSDVKNNKTNFVTLYGVQKAKLLADDYTQTAINIIKEITDSADLLDFTNSLLNRKF